MDAFFARNRLSALLDGDLDPAEEAELRAAMAADPALAAEWAALTDAVAALRASGPVRAPAGFEARVMAEVQEAAGPGGVVVRLRAAVGRLPVEALALAAAAAVVVVVIQGRPTDSGERAATEAAATEAVVPAPVLQAAAPKAEKPADAPMSDPAQTPRPPDRRVDVGPRAGAEAVAAPGGAYVPDWDQGDERQAEVAADGQPAEVGTVVGLRLLVSDPNVPLHLVNMCEGVGGMVLDGRGRPVRAAALTAEDNFTTVQLVVPAAAAPDFARDLEALGARPAGRAEGVVGVDHVGFRVEVVFNP